MTDTGSKLTFYPDDLGCLSCYHRRMNDEQFRVIRGLMVMMIAMLGFIVGLLLVFAWHYL
jgi:hypothetical protein